MLASRSSIVPASAASSRRTAARASSSAARTLSGGLPTLHHAQPLLIQQRRVSRHGLRRAREQLVGLAAAAGGCRCLGRLDHPQNGGLVRGRGTGVAQRSPQLSALWFAILARAASFEGKSAQRVHTAAGGSLRFPRRLTSPEAVRSVPPLRVGP